MSSWTLGLRAWGSRALVFPPFSSCCDLSGCGTFGLWGVTAMWASGLRVGMPCGAFQTVRPSDRGAFELCRFGSIPLPFTDGLSPLVALQGLTLRHTTSVNTTVNAAGLGCCWTYFRICSGAKMRTGSEPPKYVENVWIPD
jgi:hypothetical protein